MEDPSSSVPPALLEHVHLISSFKYPQHQQSLSLDTATDYLLAAGDVVRNKAAVSWQYVRPPRDGTVFLAWQPKSRLQDTYATDGYFWPYKESNHHLECKGCIIQITTADCGYIPNAETVASHCRKRYSIHHRVDGGHSDDKLEIVHYLSLPPESRKPVDKLESWFPHESRLVKSRRYLESVGELARKEFMLADKANWPKITMPGSQQQQFTGPPGGMPRMHLGGAGAQLRGVNQPAGRGRPRGFPTGPGMGPRATPVLSEADAELMDEDIGAAGDFLDQTRPRDISLVRFKNHNDYMDEINYAPYADHSILPANPLESLPENSELARALGDLAVQDYSELPMSEEQFQTAKERLQKYTDEKGVEASEDRKEMAQFLFDMQRKDRLLAMMNPDLTRLDKLCDQVELLNEEYLAADDDKTFIDLLLEKMDPQDLAYIYKELEAKDQQESFTLRRPGPLMTDEETKAHARTVEPALGNNGNNIGDGEFDHLINADSAGEALDFYNGDFDMTEGLDFEITE